MIQPLAWFERRFAFDLPVGAYLVILERLRGTPARLEERVRGLSQAVLTRRQGDRWSIQENVGHLGDLEPLWARRLEDFLAGRDALCAADLTNRTTHEANHNASRLEVLLAAFRTARLGFVRRLEQADEATVVRSARHPRLDVPMRLIDHGLFVAEHDDHHLACIGQLVRAFGAADA